MSDKTKDVSAIATFIRLVRGLPQPWLLIIVALLAIVTGLLEVAIGHMLKLLMNSGIGGDLSKFTRYSYTTALVLVALLLGGYLRTVSSGYYAEKGTARLREELGSRLLYVRYGEIEKQHSGDYLSRLTNDLNRVRTFLSQSAAQAIQMPVTSVAAFIYLFSISWKLTLIMVVVVPILLFSGALISRPMARFSRQQQERLAEVNAVAIDSIGGADVARAFNLTEHLNGKYHSAVSRALEHALSLAKRQAGLMTVSFLLNFTPLILCFGLGGYWVLQGEMSPGGLIAFVNLSNRLTFPVSSLPRLLGQIRSDMAAAKRIFEVLEQPLERTDGTQAANIGEHIVELKNVSFTYPGRDEQVLTDVSFAVERGQVVALVGPSGSGKSTVLKLLMGLYDNYQGQVKVFGQSLRDWDLRQLRERMALVSQHSHLFPGTIRENITMGKLDASEEEIEAAARAAYAHEFVMSFEKGYDSDVGELGGRLSGGQKQRIALARAILRDAPLLLLDEATSALDTESEAMVQQALYDLMEDRTVLVVAHRLSTIKHADLVLVLNQGRIVESGTHEDLLAQGGLYRQLYLRQLSSEAQTEKEAVS